MVSLVLGKVYENCKKIKNKKCYFMKLTSKRVITTGNPLFFSKDKILTKFGYKKLVSLVLGKVYENCIKIKEKRYFTKLTSKSVISTGNPLFGPKIR